MMPALTNCMSTRGTSQLPLRSYKPTNRKQATLWLNMKRHRDRHTPTHHTYTHRRSRWQQMNMASIGRALQCLAAERIALWRQGKCLHLARPLPSSRKGFTTTFRHCQRRSSTPLTPGWQPGCGFPMMDTLRNVCSAQKRHGWQRSVEQGRSMLDDPEVLLASFLNVVSPGPT